MLDQNALKNAYKEGIPALKNFFDKLPKEDALKGIGVLVIMAVGYKIIDAIKDIVSQKKD